MVNNFKSDQVKIASWFSILAIAILGFAFAGFDRQATPKGAMARGKKVYEVYCLTCHQADGSGVQNMNPPLIKSKMVSGDPKKLISIVLEGLNVEIEIDGETYSSPMPPQAHLSDQEIADVLTFVRNSFGNRAPGIDAVLVAKERKKVK